MLTIEHDPGNWPVAIDRISQIVDQATEVVGLAILGGEADAEALRLMAMEYMIAHGFILFWVGGPDGYLDVYDGRAV